MKFRTPPYHRPFAILLSSYRSRPHTSYLYMHVYTKPVARCDISTAAKRKPRVRSSRRKKGDYKGERGRKPIRESMKRRAAAFKCVRADSEPQQLSEVTGRVSLLSPSYTHTHTLYVESRDNCDVAAMPAEAYVCVCVYV